MTEYERVPTEPGEDEGVQEAKELLKRDPRFNQPTPSPWKRALLVIFIVLLFWLAIRLRYQARAPPAVVHASRYSKEFKFRPAASPIVTERLKDGRVRVRGAYPSTR